MKKVILVCLTVFMILSLVACGAESAQKKAIKNYYKMEIDYDDRALEKCLPKDFVENLMDEYGDDEVEQALERISDNLYLLGDSYEENLGKNIKVSIEITSSKQVDDEEYERIQKQLEVLCIDDDDIEDIVEVKYKLTLKGSEDDRIRRNDDTMVKIDGKWYRMSFMQYFLGYVNVYNYS